MCLEELVEVCICHHNAIERLYFCLIRGSNCDSALLEHTINALCVLVWIKALCRHSCK